MNQTYQRLTWKNDETLLSADNLNNIESGVEDAYNAINIKINEAWQKNIGFHIYRYENVDIDEYKIPISNCVVICYMSSAGRGFAEAFDWHNGGYNRHWTCHLHRDSADYAWSSWIDGTIVHQNESIITDSTTAYKDTEQIVSTITLPAGSWVIYGGACVVADASDRFLIDITTGTSTSAISYGCNSYYIQTGYNWRLNAERIVHLDSETTYNLIVFTKAGDYKYSYNDLYAVRVA